MSTAVTENAEVELDVVHDIRKLIEAMQPHFTHLVHSFKYDVVKVRVGDTVESTPYVNVEGVPYRLTKYGIVAEESTRHIVEPLASRTLCKLPQIETLNLRKQLHALAEKCFGGTVFASHRMPEYV
jgi:hypothetical protein